MDRFPEKTRMLMVSWSILLLVGIATCAAGDAVEDVIRVQVTGTLRTGLMAIGGETTGTTITSNGVTWELDLRKIPEQRAELSRLDGKKVTVTGTYERRRGVEIPQREIVTVTELKPARTKQLQKDGRN